MAFINKVFQDGEHSYDTPQWKLNLEKIEQEIKPTDFVEKNRSFSKDEVGIKHPTNNSYIRITDNGTIEAFTAYGTGIRINTDNTMQFFANKIQQIGKELDFHTSPNNAIDHSEYKTYPKDKGLSTETTQRLESLGLNTYSSQEWKTP